MSSKSCAVICFCPSDRFILPPTYLICLYLDRNNNQIAWYYTSCELRSSLCVFQKTVPTISTFYIFVKMMTTFKTSALVPTCLVPHVLLCPTRSRALHVSCFTCSRATRASCLGCSRFSRASCLVCSHVPRALCLGSSRVSRTSCLICPHVPRASCHTCSYDSRASCPTCAILD